MQIGTLGSSIPKAAPNGMEACQLSTGIMLVMPAGKAEVRVHCMLKSHGKDLPMGPGPGNSPKQLAEPAHWSSRIGHRWAAGWLQSQLGMNSVVQKVQAAQQQTIPHIFSTAESLQMLPASLKPTCKTGHCKPAAVALVQGISLAMLQASHPIAGSSCTRLRIDHVIQLG